MSRQDDIKKLISQKDRRLQLLRETEAKRGGSVDPGVIMEIEDIEVELLELRTELGRLQEIGVQTSEVTTSPADKKKQILN